MESRCCGDTFQRDCDSFCGPSFKLQRHLPVFKARKYYNTWLGSDDQSGENEDEEEEEETRPDGDESFSDAGHQPWVREPVRDARRIGPRFVEETFTNSDCSGRSWRSGRSGRSLPPVATAPAQDANRGQPPQRRRQSRRQPKAVDVRPPMTRRERMLEEEPIDYMRVYHRLRMGRFGFPYDFPAFGATGSTCSDAAKANCQRLQQRRQSGSSGRTANANADAAAAAAAARDTGLAHLLRLLRSNKSGGRLHDGDHGGSKAATGSDLSPSEQPPPPAPVPKPRKSTSSRTTSSRSEATSAAAAAANARSLRSGASRPRRPVSTSLTTACGPFASSAVCVAKPFNAPRRRCLSPTLVTSSSFELAPAKWQHLRYRCADLRLHQRLSVTGRLLGRGDGVAPCRWLGSSALLTQLRHPSRIELTPQAPSVAVAATALAQTRRRSGNSSGGSGGSSVSSKLCMARAAEAPTVRFAFHAMNKRRSSRSIIGGQVRMDASKSSKEKRNLYAVSVS